MLNYKIITADKSTMNEALEVVEEKVQRYIQMGYEPLGGISIATRGKYAWYYAAQAVIKR